MLRPLRSELYRLVRRRMPLVILGLMFAFGFVLYELLYTSVNTQLRAIRSGQLPPNATGPGGVEGLTKQLQDTLEQLRPAHISEIGIGLVAGLGAVMLIVYAASSLGNEYGWGTLRTLLASGVSRGAFLGAKYASLLIYALVFTAVGVVSVTIASYLVSLQAGYDTSGADAGTILSAAWRTAYAFLPYIALAALIALWSRSSGAGIAAGLVIYFAESIVMQLLISFNKDYATVANLGISRNVSSLSRVSVNVTTNAQGSGATTLPDQTQAALVLALWTVIFVALAYWRLRTRDVTLA